jgi:hypothetical protein
MLGMVYSIRGKVDLLSKCTIIESKAIRAQAAREWMLILEITVGTKINFYRTTVEGELGVASFLVNFFKRGPFPDTCGGAPLPGCTSKVPLLTAERSEHMQNWRFPPPSFPILPSSFSNPARVSAFVSAIMAPQLSAAQHILIKSLLKEGFENKLIALEASCSVRAVQRIRLKQFEMPTPRTNRVSRQSYITSPMQKALYNILIEQPYLYRCEIADFLYYRFCKRILDRSIGWTLQSIG